MTKEKLIRYGKDYLHDLETACCPISDIHKEFVREAIKALELVEEFEKAQIITGGRLNGRTYAYKCGLEDGKRKALEQQPCEDKVTITFNKGTLKHSDKGYVVYNKDWFRKHFATEVEIMTGYDGYIEQPTSDDCVSRTQAIEWIENLRQMDKCFGNYEDDYFPLSEVIDRLKNVPPVTPTFPKGTTNGDMIKAMFPNIEADEIKTDTGGYIEVKYLDTTDKRDATAFRKNWWNAPYKRGSEDADTF